MPEIKHNFTGGKMNKDLDERLVPNGEYRHAENIQVRTTGSGADGLGAAGTVQNIESNAIISNFSDYLSTQSDLINQETIGSIADEKSDVAYFFMAARQLDGLDISAISEEELWIDSIYEQHVNSTTIPVVVDVYGVSNMWDNVQGNNG